MPSKQGDLALLESPIAKELLQSTIPARFAYSWTDGTPRVIPIWFHWDGREFVLGTPSTAPKVKALRGEPKVSLTIDENGFPPRVLLIRGTARSTVVDGVVPEYAKSAVRYLGEDAGNAWVKRVGGMFSQMVRIAVKPEWVGLLDFKTRFPVAIEEAAAKSRG